MQERPGANKQRVEQSPVHGCLGKASEDGCVREGCLVQDDGDGEADGNGQTNLHTKEGHAEQGDVEDKPVKLVHLQPCSLHSGICFRRLISMYVGQSKAEAEQW